MDIQNDDIRRDIFHHAIILFSLADRWLRVSFSSRRIERCPLRVNIIDSEVAVSSFTWGQMIECFFHYLLEIISVLCLFELRSANPQRAFCLRVLCSYKLLHGYWGEKHRSDLFNKFGCHFLQILLCSLLLGHVDACTQDSVLRQDVLERWNEFVS
jgi:hypothetical protein